jgi:hypothetical protein
VWLEAPFSLTDYSGSQSVADNTSIDFESQTEGKLPKGIVSFYGYLRATSPAAVGKQLYTRKSISGNPLGIRILNEVASVEAAAHGWQPCDSNGDFAIMRNDTFANVYIRIQAVQVAL